jgi:hypothetical protein
MAARRTLRRESSETSRHETRISLTEKDKRENLKKKQDDEGNHICGGWGGGSRGGCPSVGPGP